MNTNTIYPSFPYEVSKTAVCVLLEQDGKFLSVSRKNDPTDFGLPGGKLDFGETLIECAIRELREETGRYLEISPWNPFMKVDENGMFTVTFKATVPVGYLGKRVEKVDEAETGVVSFVEKEALCKGSFGSYNQAMLAHFGY